jgi:hypothetical protein
MAEGQARRGKLRVCCHVTPEAEQTHILGRLGRWGLVTEIGSVTVP